MMCILRTDKCDACNKTLQHEDEIIALIPGIEIDKRFSTGQAGIIRLKLSKDSINSRTLKVYCKDCLTIEDYIDGN